MPRTMGLDVGTKTVGIAVSDELGITAQGVTTLRRTSQKADLAALRDLIAEHEVNLLLVGLPLNMDGSEGPRAQAVRSFAELLERATGLRVQLWDERLSTVEAERVLLQADVTRKKRREVIDQLAAQVILQGWLDAQRARHGDEDEPMGDP